MTIKFSLSIFQPSRSKFTPESESESLDYTITMDWQAFQVSLLIPYILAPEFQVPAISIGIHVAIPELLIPRSV